MFFSINPTNGLAIFDQIVRQVKFAVASGTLTPGDMGVPRDFGGVKF